MATNTTNQVTKLRGLFKEPNISAYIVYSEDAHQSEYTPNSDKRRAFISGFTGSAGVAVVTEKDAALWTDGRYYLQASQQLDSNWVLMKSTEPTTPSIHEWLNKTLPQGSRVGLDPKLVSIASARTLESALKHHGNSLVPVFENLVDKVWENKPQNPKGKVTIHQMKYAGESHNEKIQKLREQLKIENVYGTVLCALDEVAWFLNLRGEDVDFNPVFISYVLVTQDVVRLYVDGSKLSPEILAHLGSLVEVKPYDAVFDDLKQLASENKSFLLDPLKTSWAVLRCFNQQQIVEKLSLVTLPKSLKNKAEIEGMKQAHLRDAAALISFFAWLEKALHEGKEKLTEVSVSDVLENFRRAQPDFVSLSFDTIAGSGPNGAIIHYKPETASCAAVSLDKMFLCDSGGQYRDGTTDVTRTLHFGNPSQREKECFTKVLKGHIALDTAVFPVGTTGRELDILARIPLWGIGLDYRHGTGHGVGAFLNVHEGPQGISFRDPTWKIPLQPGMTVTNEPGYYEDGAFGIRIENVMIVKSVDLPNNFMSRGFLGFESITLVPIQRKLMEISLMTPNEIQWVNEYHHRVWEAVSPLLKNNEEALAWLKRETQKI